MCIRDRMNTIQIFSSVVYENRAGSKRITVEFALIQRLCLLMMLFVPTLMLGCLLYTSCGGDDPDGGYGRCKKYPGYLRDISPSVCIILARNVA